MNRREAVGHEAGEVLGEDTEVTEDLVDCWQNLAFLPGEMGSCEKALKGGVTLLTYEFKDPLAAGLALDPRTKGTAGSPV